MYDTNVFPKNSMAQDPNLRDSVPLVEQSVDFSGSLVAGALVVDNVVSSLDPTELIGATVYSNSNASGLVLGAKVGVGSTSGTIKVTIVASATASTAAVSGTAFVLGRITPTNV